MQAKYTPYRRESFVEKHFIIDFDTNFNMTDESASDNARAKNMTQLKESIDSIENYLQRQSKIYKENMERYSLAIPHEARISDYDSLTVTQMNDSVRKKLEKAEERYLAEKEKRGMKVATSTVNVDSLMAGYDSQKQQQIMMTALQKVGFQEMDSRSKEDAMEWDEKQIRLHWIQYWLKITMSLSCLIFFFVGAPLGAIIRKGGLGFPVVVAVIIFILYYIIDTGAMKVSREGGMPVWIGMWISTLVMAPLGILLTVKSNNDSAVFNLDAYVMLWKKILGIRPKRNIVRNEVIINDPDYMDMKKTLDQLIATSREYLGSLPRSTFFGYMIYIVRYWFSKREDIKAEGIMLMTEYVVEVLSNSKDRQVLRLLNGYPVMETRNFRFYRRRRKDLRAVIKYSEQIKNEIEKYDTVQYDRRSHRGFPSGQVRHCGGR